MNTCSCGRTTRGTQCFDCFKKSSTVEAPHSCVICGKPCENELCGYCQGLIELAGRDPELLRKAADYLEH